MRYEGIVYRPPSEAYSLLVQITIGCSYNQCDFCSMYRGKRFRVRDVKAVTEDLETARARYQRVGRIFLCDGDAFCLSAVKLKVILDKIRELFPECERVGIYGSARDILRKTPEEMRELWEGGLGIVYIGAESGSQRVLDSVNKGVTREELIAAVHRIEDSGMKASVTFISGLAGRDGWKEHATETGRMISEMNASYVGLLTLMLDAQAPIVKKIERGEFSLLTPREVAAETRLLLKNADPSKPCVFRSNHASNYISLRGSLPDHKARMMRQLEEAMENEEFLKDERFRAL